VDKSRLAAKITKGFRIGLVLQSKDKKQIVFSVWEEKMIKAAEGVIYNETVTEIWRSDSDGNKLRRVATANSNLVGWVP